FRSWYSAYALLIVGGSLVYEILLLHFKLADDGDSTNFTNAVFNTLLSIIATRIAASLLIIACCSGKLANVLNLAEGFEASMSPYKCRRQKKSRDFIDILRRLLWLLSFVVFALSRYLFFAELTSELPPSTAKVATSAFVIASTLALSTASHIVQIIATIIYGVFTDDLECLYGVVKVRLSVESMLCRPRTAKVLEDIRLKYLGIRKIVQELNDVLQYSTFVSFACTLLTLCTCAYLISETDSSWGRFVFTTSYAVSISLELLDITVSVSQLKGQVSTS
ncbi:unnamed protein product, partial [Ixodes hexagonus]